MAPTSPHTPVRCAARGPKRATHLDFLGDVKNRLGFSSEMGAEREGADPNPKRERVGADPSGSATSRTGDAGPAAVDFDALHAALGDVPPSELQEDPDVASESSGRTNATYASTRPHAIP